MQRASSLFPSGKSLKSVAVDFGFALTTENDLGLSWTLIALFSFSGVKNQLFVGLRAFRVAVF